MIAFLSHLAKGLWGREEGGKNEPATKANRATRKYCEQP